MQSDVPNPSPQRLDPERYARTRRWLRRTGPVVVALGLLCIVIAFVDLFGAINSKVSGPPTLFFLAFIGMPLTFVGLVMTTTGFQRDLARYHASELGPVSAELANYMGSATAPGIAAAASAIREGLAPASDAPTVACPACKRANDHDSKFCDSCGIPLINECQRCRHPNDLDARYCDQCGSPLPFA